MSKNDLTVCIVPLCGRGQRFKDEGFLLPKPMIDIDGESIIYHSMQSIYPAFKKLIFIVRESDVLDFSIDAYLKSKFGDDTIIVVSNKETKGAVESVLLAKDHLKDNDRVFLWCSDIKCDELDPNAIHDDVDGLLYTFKSNNPAYSYCQIENDVVTKVEEKKVISEWANVGGYYFKSWKIFKTAAKRMIDRDDTINGEFYISKVYNYMIKKGLKVKHQSVEKIYIFGTPSEYRFYRDCALNEFKKEKAKIGICADHSGFGAKELAKTVLSKLGFEWNDYGCHSTKACDYVTYAQGAIEALNRKDVQFILLFCATGEGMCITANKNPNVRCALIFDEYVAEMSIRHNCANAFAFPAVNMNEKLLEKIITKMSQSTHDGGRHENRLIRMMEMNNG